MDLFFIPEISSVVILYSLCYFYYAVLFRESSPKVTWTWFGDEEKDNPRQVSDGV
uniref:Uncharacterized protein n=1 Tax=Vitis vinifera TaxID=29760 RepID=A5BI70_VITVI|nr:hypothetical protein VITISV_038209 [Vitis vinifera]